MGELCFRDPPLTMWFQFSSRVLLSQACRWKRFLKFLLRVSLKHIYHTLNRKYVIPESLQGPDEESPARLDLQEWSYLKASICNISTLKWLKTGGPLSCSLLSCVGCLHYLKGLRQRSKPREICHFIQGNVASLSGIISPIVAVTSGETQDVMPESGGRSLYLYVHCLSLFCQHANIR